MASNTDSGVTSDSVGGTVNPGSTGETFDQAPNNNAGAATDPSISAGYGSNVDYTPGQGEDKKPGFLSKVKDKLLPKGPGPTPTEDVSTRDAAMHAHHASHAGNDLRSAQANTDLNRE